MNQDYYVWLAFNPEGESMNILAKKENNAWFKLTHNHLQYAPKEYYQKEGYTVRKFKLVEVTNETK